MLLIGAAGRKCGKTLLAEGLLAIWGRDRAMAGAKVTTVHEDEKACPHGGEGCGACTSFEGPFRIVEEAGEARGKDTTRLLDAGARPVVWLCVRKTRLLEGARELVRRLGADTPTLCESNSLRTVLDPGLFVIVRRRGETTVKRSCRRVWDMADAILEFDGARHDPPMEAFSLDRGRWCLRRKATAIVLAGRNGATTCTDRALSLLDGEPLVKHVVDQLRPHFDRILVSTGDPERFSFLGVPIVEDSEPAQCTMTAIAKALARSEDETNLVVPCDLAHLPVDLMYRLLRRARTGCDVVVPVSGSGVYAPLFAVYNRHALAHIEKRLEEGSRSSTDIYEKCETIAEPSHEGGLFGDVDTGP